MKSASLFLAAMLAAFAVFAPVLDLPYVTDDIDHLQAVGGLRAGRLSFAQWLFLPHNEHIVPVLRLFDLYFTGRWGFNAGPAYAVSVFWYGLCGGLTGLLAYRSTKSLIRGLSAALLFAAVGTMAPMVVTMLTAAMFTQALAFYLLAMATANPRLRMVFCAAACVCFPGSFPFGIAVAVYSWPEFGWRAGAAWAGLSAVVVAVHTAAHSSAGSPPKAINLMGAPTGMWIPYTAPFRLIWSWTGSEMPSITMIGWASAIAWVAVWWMGRRTDWKGPRRLILALAAGAVLQSLLTGAGRAEAFNLGDFFWTDRYYAFFLAPAALLIACPAPRHWALVCAAAALLWPARAEMNRKIPPPALGAAAVAPLDRASRLAAMLAEELRRNPGEPFVVADDFLPMTGVHKGGLNLSTVVYVSFPDGLAGLRFAEQLTPEQRRRLNDLLFRWRVFSGLPV